MKYTAIVVANGIGERMNLGYNKVYHKLQDGKTILRHAMNLFMCDEDCAQIIVVTSADDFKEYWNEFWPGKIMIVRGGKTRQDSVYNGVMAAKEDYVFIHDGARPYLEEKELNELKDSMSLHDACILAVPCKDTIKMVREDNIEETLEREKLYAAQTPQAFKRDLLVKCFDKAISDNFVGTDDSSLVERYSKVKVRIVIGSYNNIKITTTEDL